MSDNLPRKLARRIAGKCQHCQVPAVTGSDFCEVHRIQNAAYGSTWTRGKRQERAEAGECISGCGSKVKVARRVDGSAKLKRCKACMRKHRAAMKSARAMRGVESAGRGVESNSADPGTGRWKLESAYVGGYTVQRYAGRGRHGGVTREEKDDALRLDLRDAVGRVEHVRLKGLAELREVEREAGTHSAKREARIHAADPLGVAMRMIAGVLAEVHPDGWEVVKEWARSLEVP